ncbi:MAG: hypothetical protein WCX31_05365, partial [Salinivirgaceae bacterium]
RTFALREKMLFGLFSLSFISLCSITEREKNQSLSHLLIEFVLRLSILNGENNQLITFIYTDITNIE